MKSVEEMAIDLDGELANLVQRYAAEFPNREDILTMVMWRLEQACHSVSNIKLGLIFNHSAKSARGWFAEREQGGNEEGTAVETLAAALDDELADLIKRYAATFHYDIEMLSMVVRGLDKAMQSVVSIEVKKAEKRPKLLVSGRSRRSRLTSNLPQPLL